MSSLPANLAFLLGIMTAASASEPAKLPAGPESTASGPRIYQIGELDQIPKATTQDQPIYPSAVTQSQINGTVDVAFVVGTTGHVIGARARKCTVLTAKSSVEFDRTLRGIDSKSRKSAEKEADYPILLDAAKKLAAAAVRGVRDWTFQPGLKGGKPVNSATAVVINFQAPQHVGTVYIRVTGRDPTTGPHHITSITNEEFSGMVASFVNELGVFSGTATSPDQATYQLDVELRVINKIQTFSTTMAAHWKLTRASDQSVVWETDITKTAHTSMGQANSALILEGQQRGNVKGLGNAIAISQNTKLVATDNAHDALKEIWNLKF